MPVDQSRVPEVAVEISAIDELCQGQLVQRCGASIGFQLEPREPPDEGSRRQHPARPQGGCQDLACGSDIDHSLRRETL